MERVEAGRRFNVSIERGFAFVTNPASSSKFWPGYEPRGGIGMFDRVLLPRGIRRASEDSFVAQEHELASGVR